MLPAATVFKIIFLPILIIQNNNIPNVDLNNVMQAIIQEEVDIPLVESIFPQFPNVTVGAVVKPEQPPLTVPYNTPDIEDIRTVTQYTHQPYGSYISRHNGRPQVFKGPSTKKVIKYVNQRI